MYTLPGPSDLPLSVKIRGTPAAGSDRPVLLVTLMPALRAGAADAPMSPATIQIAPARAIRSV